MNAYSKDLRLKTLAAIDRGIPRAEVQELFLVSRSTIKRWLNRRRQTGGVETMKIPGRPALKGEALREWLPEQLKSNPDLTLRVSGSIARLFWMRRAWRSRKRL